MNFVDALKTAEGVFEQYRKDQPKWWSRMDGTPTLNDVAVRMAEAFRTDTRKLVEVRAVLNEMRSLAGDMFMGGKTTQEEDDALEAVFEAVEKRCCPVNENGDV